MKIFSFFSYIFKHFPSLILFNTLILIFMGLLDSAAVLSLTPVVDVLINPDMRNISSITKKIVEMMGRFGIPVSLGSLLLIFIIFNLFKSLIYIFSRYSILKTKYALLRTIILGTFEDFFRARWFFFSSHKEGTLLNTFMREITVVGDAFGAMAGFFAQMIQGIVFLGVPFYISWQVSSISIVSAILLALPFTLFGRLSYRLGKMNTLTANVIGSVILESLNSAKVILGFGNQSKSLSSLSVAFDAHRHVAIKSQTLDTAIPQFYYPLGVFVLAIALFSGRYFSVPVSELVVIIYAFSRIIPLLGGITAQKTSLSNFFPSYEQVMGLRQKARELKQKTGSKIFSGLNQGITIDGVSFGYDGGQPILEDIHAKIPKGKMIAFVGKSGAGKSTFVDMIMGFNEPLKGRVAIDGVSLQEFDIHSYRQRIGYVPQDSILFNMSIRDNLRWAKENATDREIKEACDIANASEFIERFPEGYDTLVGDRGVRLSGGQIQRIALARAILRNPDILILDEATSNLDTESERLIQQAIENIAKRTTIIAIAHRISTIIHADYIYVLDDGRVVEEGTYQQLVKKNGLFSQMVQSQQLEFKDAGRSGRAD
jgi:ATP-binding cassette subfamily B protein